MLKFSVRFTHTSVNRVSSALLSRCFPECCGWKRGGLAPPAGGSNSKSREHLSPTPTSSLQMREAVPATALSESQSWLTIAPNCMVNATVLPR